MRAVFESGPVKVMMAADMKERISGAVGVAWLVPDLRSQIARHIILNAKSVRLHHPTSIPSNKKGI